MQMMTHVPISTMSRLSSLTPADIEPDQLRVAARLPAALQVQPQGVKVKIDRETTGGGGGTDEFVLEPVVQATELRMLSKYQRAGASLSIFRLSSADTDRLRRILVEMTSPSSTSRVRITAGVDACYRSPLGSTPLPVTTWLRTNHTGYFVLAEDLNLRNIVPEADLATKVPPCVP